MSEFNEASLEKALLDVQEWKDERGFAMDVKPTHAWVPDATMEDDSKRERIQSYLNDQAAVLLGDMLAEKAIAEFGGDEAGASDAFRDRMARFLNRLFGDGGNE